MVISGFLCYGISGLFFAKGIGKVHLLTVNIICMSEVIKAPLWTYILFHETLGVRSLIGVIRGYCFEYVLRLYGNTNKDIRKKLISYLWYE